MAPEVFTDLRRHFVLGAHVSQSPVLDPEMVDDSGQPEAPQSETPLAPRDYGDLLGESFRVPEPVAEEPEPDQPTAELETPTPQLPQSAAEWMAAIDASPGREAQVPGKFRTELRELREQRHAANTAAAVATARAEARQEAEQRVLVEMALARDVATIDSWLDDSSENYDPLKFAKWIQANPAGHAQYAAYKANADAPAQQTKADPLALIHELNQDVINEWNARPEVTAQIQQNVAAGKYGANAVSNGRWTERGLTLALRDVQSMLHAAPQAKPDPAAQAVEQRQAAAAERGAIPRTVSGGAPSGGGVSVASVKSAVDAGNSQELLALKKRDPEGYERAVIALSKR